MRSAVVIPFHKTELSDLERFSLSRCVTVLGHHPIVLFGPRSIHPAAHLRLAPRASVYGFADAHFSSIASYSRLLLSPSFYEAFADFDYMLVHQLDAFVFRDSLAEWCSRQYDYLGAPWWNEARSLWWGVGNGGFSLRNVRSCLAVLRSPRTEDPDAYWAMERVVTDGRLRLALKYYRKWQRQLGFRENVRAFLARFTAQDRPEDLFWGLHAVRFHPSFRVAPITAGLNFAIEGGLLEAQAHYASNPPFGCHQERFLRMISRFTSGAQEPAGEYEALVWTMAEKAGLSPRGTGTPGRRG
jgi:hypothetical protein